MEVRVHQDVDELWQCALHDKVDPVVIRHLLYEDSTEEGERYQSPLNDSGPDVMDREESSLLNQELAGNLAVSFLSLLKDI